MFLGTGREGFKHNITPRKHKGIITGTTTHRVKTPLKKDIPVPARIEAPRKAETPSSVFSSVYYISWRQIFKYQRMHEAKINKIFF